MSRSVHCCDERCDCPACGSPMYYARPTADRPGEHGCSNPDCPFAGGEHAVQPSSVARFGPIPENVEMGFVEDGETANGLKTTFAEWIEYPIGREPTA